MRKSWGKAKIEVLALKSDILQLSAQGMNLSEIHRQLTSLEKLTICLRTFSVYAKQICRPDVSQSLQEPKPASTPVVHKIDDGESLSTGGTFSYDPSATDEDLW